MFQSPPGTGPPCDHHRKTGQRQPSPEEATGAQSVLDKVREKRFEAVTSPPACPAERDLQGMARGRASEAQRWARPCSQSSCPRLATTQLSKSQDPRDRASARREPRGPGRQAWFGGPAGPRQPACQEPEEGAAPTQPLWSCEASSSLHPCGLPFASAGAPAHSRGTRAVPARDQGSQGPPGRASLGPHSAPIRGLWLQL